MRGVRVKERSNYNVVKIPSSESVQVVAEIILVKSISSVIIVGDGIPVGIVTERDLIRAFYKNDEVGVSDPISKMMSSPIYTINENKSIQEAVQKMILKGYRQLGVTNNNGKLVAMCSMNDLIRDFSINKNLLTETQHYIEKQGTDITEKISREIDQLIEELSGNSGPDKNSLPQYKLQRLLVRIKQITKNRENANNEQPVLFLLTNSNGLSLYSKKVVDLPTNSQLMSGFFHSINEWMREIVVEEGFIDQMRYLDYTIIIRSIGSFQLYYMFKGEVYLGLPTIERLIQILLNDEILHEFLKNDTDSISKREEARFDNAINTLLEEIKFNSRIHN